MFLLKERKKLTIIMLNKIKIMFKVQFLFLSIMFIKNVEKFNYFSLIDDEALMSYHEIMKIIYKINFDKIFKINKLTVRVEFEFKS